MLDEVEPALARQKVADLNQAHQAVGILPDEEAGVEQSEDGHGCCKRSPEDEDELPRARLLFRIAGLRVTPAPCGWGGSWTGSAIAIGREALALPPSLLRATRLLFSTD